MKRRIQQYFVTGLLVWLPMGITVWILMWLMGLLDGIFLAILGAADLAPFKDHPHGIGLAEAESPYPDEKATYPLAEGMCVNSDISLFGHPDGSNRIEEGFVITKKGPESLTPFIREMCRKGI